MVNSVTFDTVVGGDGSTVTDDDNATTGLLNGGQLLRYVPTLSNVVNIAKYIASSTDGIDPVVIAENAATATTQAGIATTKAAEAAASAAAASAIVLSNEPIAPTIRPSLLLDFANAKSLDPRITFSRSSIGTRVNEKGLVEVMAANQPRFDHDPVTGECKGLLIEEARTNLLTYSEQFDNAAWTKANVTVTANANTAPDGTMTADKLVENTATGQHMVSEEVSCSNGTYTFSAYVKKAERNIVFLGMSDGVTALVGAFVNLDTLAVTLATGGSWSNISATVTQEPNQFVRIRVSATSGSGTSIICRIINSNLVGSTSYTGDGASGIYIWGAQLEAGSFATSYIPTTSAQVTRNADLASITGTNFSSWYRQDEGTVFAKQTVYPTSNQAFITTFDDGTGTWGKRICLAKNAATTTSPIAIFNVNNTGTADVQLGIGTTPNTIESFTYKINDYAFSADGLTAVTDTSVSVPTGLARLVIGSSPIGSAYLNGHISKLAYYPKRLSNAELVALSTQ